MAQNFPNGVTAYGPESVKGTGRPDPTFSGISDCGVWADSNAGAGLLGSCNTGFGAAGVLGDPASVPDNQEQAGVLGSSKTKGGVLGVSEDSFGIHGRSNDFIGAMASSLADFGVYGQSRDSVGVYGYANGEVADDNPEHIGVTGESGASSGTGVFGVCQNTDFDVFGPGVRGFSTKGTGVLGESIENQGVWGDSQELIGVCGTSDGDKMLPKARPGQYGPKGRGPAFTHTAAGVAGTAYGNGGIGVHGQSVSGPGVFGYSYTDYAGYFAGKVYVSGSLVKAGGGFRIDHPLNPANQCLNHSFVESPERKNLYDGLAVLNRSGGAVVVLPKWFLALNKDFRYQLTAMGAPGPNLHISQSISKNRFRIAGGKPGMKVSWQVTGVRRDAWAKANPMPVEEKKPKRGHYLHPELFGQPATKRMDLQDPAASDQGRETAVAEAKREAGEYFKRPLLPTFEPRAPGSKSEPRTRSSSPARQNH